MISPYTIYISDDRLAAIKAKVEAYDWSQLPDAGGWISGVGVNDLKRLVDYWRKAYDDVVPICCKRTEQTFKFKE